MSEEETVAQQMASGAIGREIDEVGLDHGRSIASEIAEPMNDGRAATAYLNGAQYEASLENAQIEDICVEYEFRKMAGIHNAVCTHLHSLSRGINGNLNHDVLSKRVEMDVETAVRKSRGFNMGGRR